ncbi:IucA/IucC family protein [Haloarcula pellucida]|uniref:Iron transporter n=1 Tax=Haloarcula pellucida TaxID=1427151 RepID=A0A830GLK3_9EURY|nr:IucA/IucC family siderophore biosynthesis protein [Halomicroarcula pellucida]MBX0350019.1 IucA/IucC family siderophore biosynthesis protein [Halomicroarcula pellucida]GGN95544.1 iron transporter [Halomicroarcula pellucida]
MNGVETLQASLRADVWTTVNRELFREVLAEFMYEELITPTPTETVRVPGAAGDDARWTRYVLALTDGLEYRFDAQERPLDSYRIRAGSIERRERGGEWKPATDPVAFVLDAREYIGIDPTTAAHLVREYNNTLVADAHIRARKEDREGSLLDLPYAEIEGEMEGHPWFTYNKGRVGFGYDDYRQYAPESKRRQGLSWIAARRNRATFAAVDGLDHAGLIDEELGDAAEAFRATLEDDGLDPANYYFLPVHDWQWSDNIVQLFAEDIATDAIVPLGEAPDEYLPQQSIRTFSNVSNPEKRHVKLPVRVLNTNVYRGILGEQAEAAPRVTEFIKSIRDGDAFLRDERRLLLPGEVASVNYEHSKFSRFDEAPYQFHELLGCVWRESVVSLIDSGERPLTLAALLHEDFDGTPVVSKLADRTGLSLEAWLDELFEVLLEPLLHFLYKYGTVFMPHGTNVVLILEEGVPSRIAVKDFVDEVAITDRELPELNEVLPADLRDDKRYKHHILHQIAPEPLCQHIFGTLCVGVFRYVADLLARHCGYDEETFWAQVRTALDTYQAQFPELEDRFELFDLTRPRFTKHCLNRNRIVDYGYDDFSTRPKVRGHGTVSNPLAENRLVDTGQ